MSALTEALGYVECLGWMIFPVRFGTKRSTNQPAIAAAVSGA